MSQADTFFDSEGDAWLKRNAKDFPIQDDLLLTAFDQLVGGLSKYSRVLEIGCSNGWRLEKIRELYGCETLAGVDPSDKAIDAAREKGIRAERNNAAFLPFANGAFDVVIFGFCLYLCDRESLFFAAAEADRVLSDSGLVAILDFSAPAFPGKVKYKHKEGLWSYHQDYDQMFLWSPAYSKILDIHSKDGQTKATLIRKNIERGWPECE